MHCCYKYLVFGVFLAPLKLLGILPLTCLGPVFQLFVLFSCRTIGNCSTSPSEKKDLMLRFTSKASCKQQPHILSIMLEWLWRLNISFQIKSSLPAASPAGNGWGRTKLPPASKHHVTVQVGRYFWRSPSSFPFLKKSQWKQTAQGCVQLGF